MDRACRRGSCPRPRTGRPPTPRRGPGTPRRRSGRPGGNRCAGRRARAVAGLAPHRAPAPAPGGPGTLRMREEPVDLLAERVGSSRVGPARVHRRAHRASPERLLDGAAPLREGGAVEEAGRIHAVGDPRHLLDGESLAMTGAEHVDDLTQGVLPVEQGDHVEQGHGQERHLVREARRVAQSNRRHAVTVDGEGLEGPEFRPLRGAGGRRAWIRLCPRMITARCRHAVSRASRTRSRLETIQNSRDVAVDVDG